MLDLNSSVVLLAIALVLAHVAVLAVAALKLWDGAPKRTVKSNVPLKDRVEIRRRKVGHAD